MQEFEGSEENNAMLFDVTQSTDTPLIIGQGEQYACKPYFRFKHIDLGNGATSGDIRIQVTSRTQDCTWKSFEVGYHDSEGQHTQQITSGIGFSVTRSRNTSAIP
ncbi:hypothetical protein ACWCV9_34585 [Streptomyces sp. NPDC001606]